MDKFNKLIILTEHDQFNNLALLAQSVGINVIQQSKSEVLSSSKIKPGTLLACPFISADLHKKGVSAELYCLMLKAPLFLYQTERVLADPKQALYAGIRGVIYRDEQLDRVLTALKTLMAGQLYYSREIMSHAVDDLMQQRSPKITEIHALQTDNLLTRQEKRIIQLVADGCRNKEIAENLNISAHTVKAHLSAIFRKTQSRNRVELLRWLQQPKQPFQPSLAKLA